MINKPNILPIAYQNVAADFIAKVHDDRNAATGSLYVQEKRGVNNQYAKITIGAKRVSRFLGPSAAAATRGKAADIKAANARAKARRKDLSILSKLGILTTSTMSGQVVAALSHFGLLASGGVLVGTLAYQAYQLTLGAALPSAILATDDADLAAAHLALEADIVETLEGRPDMLEILHYADSTFQTVAGLDTRSPAARFRAANGYAVDLVTPQRTRNDKQPLPLTGLGAGATSLPYLAWLINDAIPAALPFGSGVAVTVPEPSRFAVHKLILSQVRTQDTIKARKDQMQARALVEVLNETNSGRLIDTVDDAVNQGKRGWRTPLLRAVEATWPQEEWRDIEAFERLA